MVKKIKDDFRKQKDIKVIRCFTYEGMGGDCISITIMDRLTGKIFAGNLSKTYNSLKEW